MLEISTIKCNFFFVEIMCILNLSLKILYIYLSGRLDLCQKSSLFNEKYLIFLMVMLFSSNNLERSLGLYNEDLVPQ